MGCFRCDGDAVADRMAGILDELLGDCDLTGFGRHATFLQVWLVDAVRADFLHGYGLVAAHIDGYALRALGLHLPYASDPSQRGDIGIARPSRR